MRALLLGLALSLAPLVSFAHFQLVYTPEVQVNKAGELPMKLIFWHPHANSNVMEMGTPEEFYVVNRGVKTDLMDTLSPITFTGIENAATAYDASLPIKRAGDYIVTLVPAPYYEAEEDKYIQQITKSFVNRSEISTDWDSTLGLKAEIVPLVKPTNVIAGGTFTGLVLSNGEPVANAEIEVEYMAAEPDLTTNSPKVAQVGPQPGGSIVIKSDSEGYFTFGVPKAGFWGFAALEIGVDTLYQDKPLSQDAVIWIRAYEMK